MNRVVLITGGARSGKSRYALELADSARSKAFIATAQPSDDEMRRRIKKHRQERKDRFSTVEAPFDLAEAIRSLGPGTELVVVECLTVWLGNLMHRHDHGATPYPEVTSFLQIAEKPPCELVIVSNELGMGIVPENEMARRFRDLAGQVNQEVAQIAYKVVFMISGIPLVAKEG